MSSFVRRLTRPLLASVLLFSAACATTPGTSGGSDANQSAAPAARVNGTVITVGEVDAKASSGLSKLRRQEFTIRKEALDALVDEKLLAAEAASRKLSTEALLDAEVTSKVSEPSPEQVELVYMENRERIGDRAREEVDPQIKEFLRSRQLEELQSSFMSGLRERYAVELLLSPPRVAMPSTGSNVKGAEDAPITIVEFSDYQCPYCSKVNPTLDAVLKKYEGKVKLIFRDFPLEFHAQARGAAEAARCAGEKGRYWEMHDAMFADQRGLEPEALVAKATALGLDETGFRACLESGRFGAAVQADMEEGKMFGVTGTPAFFVNGIMIEGAQPPEAFSEIIDAELLRMK